MKYYASESDHGSDSSFGFCNDTTVFVFSSKSNRDTFIEDRDNISCVAIKRSEATSRAINFIDNDEIKPRPFSQEYWGIVAPFDHGITGLIGTLQVCDDFRLKGERFYA